MITIRKKYLFIFRIKIKNLYTYIITYIEIYNHATNEQIRDYIVTIVHVGPCANLVQHVSTPCQQLVLVPDHELHHVDGVLQVWNWITTSGPVMAKQHNNRHDEGGQSTVNCQA